MILKIIKGTLNEMLRHATKAMQYALPLNSSSFAIFLDLLYDRVYFLCLLKIKPGFSMNKRASLRVFVLTLRILVE